MRPIDRTVERAIERIASASHGVVTRAELLDAGVTSSELKHRVATGALMRQHPGVYRVGHRAPSLEAQYLAAVRACGKRAVLSGRAAAYLLGLLRGSPPPPEVTAPTQRRVRGVVTHRARRGLDLADVTKWRGIPVTTVARTLVDLAPGLSTAALARACHEAGVKHAATPAEVEAVLVRRPTSPGSGRLRAISRGEVRVTLSKLESRFLDRLREAALPLPETNRVAGGRRVDCRWPKHRLTVELHSYRYHSSRYAWERDRQREREARARGDEFRRYTYADVCENPALMLTDLTGLLGMKRPRPRSQDDR